MSRQDALRKDLKALEWLRDRLAAQWNESHKGGEQAPRDDEKTTRDLNRVNEAEYADPRKVFRN